MGEIRSNYNTASDHSGAIRSAAAKLQDGLTSLNKTQENIPESSLISCYNTLRTVMIALSNTLSSDAGNIEKIGASIRNMDNRLGRGLLP